MVVDRVVVVVVVVGNYVEVVGEGFDIFVWIVSVFVEEIVCEYIVCLCDFFKGVIFVFEVYLGRLVG